MHIEKDPKNYARWATHSLDKKNIYLQSQHEIFLFCGLVAFYIWRSLNNYDHSNWERITVHIRHFIVLLFYLYNCKPNSTVSLKFNKQRLNNLKIFHTVIALYIYLCISVLLNALINMHYYLYPFRCDEKELIH